MPDLPTGTITFLFTDVEGSTRLWEQHPALMPTAAARHDVLLRSAIEAHRGYIVKSTGDGFHAAFDTAVDALSAALHAQRSLLAEPWIEPVRLRVRMGLHTGSAEIRDGDYDGVEVNRAARIMAIAHGGQVLLSDALFGLVREGLPEDADVKDLGEHRLKDLGRPEQVYQLMHSDLPAEFSPLRSLNVLPNNLPIPLTSFVGRERELEDVKRLLGQTRLLTLTGSGGCGKSRLALQAAADLLDDYPHGIWLVELAPLSDPDLVPPAVAQSLDLLLDGSRPVMHVLLDYLKPRNLLLIVDNCEHLLPACAALADGLLKACPKLRILASSREGLAIGGEAIYPTPSLGLPAPGDPLERIRQHDAVRLFAERVAATTPGFALTEENAPLMAEVCRRLDGIPLALELAAARVRTMPLSEFSKRLGDMFRLLTGGSRTALPRQQTLRAMIDWSYNLLSEGERTLLRRLSVFAGGCTLEAAEAICSGEGLEEWEVLDGLGSLVDKSLMSLELREGEGRYRLLETVRQYGRDRLLESGEGEGIRDRHLDYFVALAEELEERGKGSGQVEALNRLESEHDNVRSALEWSDQDARQERLAAAMGHFWEVRGHCQEGLAWLDRVLEREPVEPSEPGGRARALEVAGYLEANGGWKNLSPKGKARMEEAIERYRERGNDAGVARSLVLLSSSDRWTTDQPELKGAQAAESVERARQSGDRFTLARVLELAGRVQDSLGDWPGAMALAEESLALGRSLGNPQLSAQAAYRIGIWSFWGGQGERARRLFEEALASGRALKYKQLIAIVLTHLTSFVAKDGDEATRIELIEEGIGLSRDLGDSSLQRFGQSRLAEALAKQGNLTRAGELFEESIVQARQNGNLKRLAAFLTGSSIVWQRLGERERAEARKKECRRLIDETPETERVHFLGGAGHTARTIGDYALARQFFAESLELRSQQTDRFSIAQSLDDHGLLAALEGRYARAIRLLVAAEGIAVSVNRKLLSRDLGDYQLAEAACRAALTEAAFAAAWAEGRAMSLEEAVHYALDEATPE